MGQVVGSLNLLMYLKLVMRKMGVLRENARHWIRRNRSCVGFGDKILGLVHFLWRRWIN